MGICIFQLNTNFFIEHQHELAVLETIRCLDPQEVQGATGMWMGSRQFAFVDTAQYRKAETVFEAFRAWRWALDTDDEGNINSIEFTGEKFGNDTVLFEAIAPFVRAGSYIEMARDDGIVGRWFFDNRMVQEQRGKIGYDENIEAGEDGHDRI